jgi:hypothetical protein
MPVYPGAFDLSPFLGSGPSKGQAPFKIKIKMSDNMAKVLRHYKLKH